MVQAAPQLVDGVSPRKFSKKSTGAHVAGSVQRPIVFSGAFGLPRNGRQFDTAEKNAELMVETPKPKVSERPQVVFHPKNWMGLKGWPLRYCQAPLTCQPPRM